MVPHKYMALLKSMVLHPFATIRAIAGRVAVKTTTIILSSNRVTSSITILTSKMPSSMAFERSSDVRPLKATQLLIFGRKSQETLRLLNRLT